jgi:hypothetical protein
MTEVSLLEWVRYAEAAAGIAAAFAQTALVPESLRVYNGGRELDLDATRQTVAGVILTGHELGLDPMASLRSIDIIRGVPALRAHTLRALIQQRGHQLTVIESTATRAIVRGRRAGQIEWMESTWTMDRAAALRLPGFNNPDSQWKRMPANMLVARATGECARWIAADALLGLPYIVEEIDDLPDAGPAQASQSAAAPEPVPPQRQPSRKRRASPPPAITGPLPPPPAPVATGEQEAKVAGPDAAAAPDPDASVLTDAEADPSGEPATPAAHRGPATITASQRKALFAGLRELGLADHRDDALAQVSAWIGRNIASTTDLTAAEASTALDALAIARERDATDDDDRPLDAPG